MKKRTLLLVAVAILLAGVAFAQRSRSGYPRNFQRPSDTPTWTNAPGFEKDVFTFVRIRYSSSYGGFGGFGGRRGGGGWATDYPDAELNFAYRLQQMTSMKVEPQGKFLEITDPELFRYPFTYIVEPGRLAFTDEEVPILRRYLLHGGFLMVDDFWGEDEWDNFAGELKRVFPDRDIVDIPRTHPMFQCVFPIPIELNLQCPNISLGAESEYHGITWERPDAREVHIRGVYDDKSRLCVVICHNTDNGDGWEREGESQYYFREFSEKKAYPLGINIIFWAMTH